MSFLTSVKEAADLFKTLQHEKPIRIISNKDTDGITAASILTLTLRKEQIPCVTTFIKQITDDFLQTLVPEQYSVYFFLDMGAGYLDKISKALSGKTIFVFDHHYPDTFASTNNTFVHLNPHLDKIDGTKDISAAGITYLFAKALNGVNQNLAHLAVIGSIGDMQEHQGFTGLNATILEDAVQSKMLTVKQGLRLFGVHTKPLYKFLEYTTNPYLPHVTGSELGSLQFLKGIGINPKIGGKFKWASELSKEDLEKLYGAIMLKHTTTVPSVSPFGPVYFLLQEEKTSPTYDAVEYSTLINSCGKMGYPSLGVGVCMGDGKSKEKAIILLTRYRAEIVTCLTWFYKHKRTEQIVETDKYVIINAENHVRDGLIGTLVSMVSKSNLYPEGTVLIGMATMLSDEIKVSTRICGFKETPVDLRKIVKEAVKKTGGYGGGHRLAAGATIPAGKGPDFLKESTSLLNKSFIEERV